MLLDGLHHITLVTADAQRNYDFYSGVLGLRLVKKTVNFDDPGSYHLYYGNEAAAPGSLLTFFEWRDARRGAYGVGGTHHVALCVSTFEMLLKWKRYLDSNGVAVSGPYDRHYFTSIYFRDPEGQTLEIATDGPGFTVDGETLDTLGTTLQPVPEAMRRGHLRHDALADQTHPEPVEAITADMRLERGMHHITAIASDIGATHAFYHDLLALRRVKQTDNFDAPGSALFYWGDAAGTPGTLVTYFEMPRLRRARLGAGQTHHFAFSVADEETQRAFREKLLEAGLRVSPVMDRVYFKSIYTHDPDGHIVELATRGPGFSVDETPETLGTSLMLPPWLEPDRASIEAVLRPIQPV